MRKRKVKKPTTEPTIFEEQPIEYKKFLKDKQESSSKLQEMIDILRANSKS